MALDSDLTCTSGVLRPYIYIDRGRSMEESLSERKRTAVPRAKTISEDGSLAEP